MEDGVGDPPLDGLSVTTSPPTASELGRRTLRATSWAYAAYLGQRGMVLVITALLARILAPAEFGLVALALMVIAVLETFADLGLSAALVIVDDERAEADSHTVFRWVLVMSAGVALVVAALGSTLATFFGEPALVRMLPVLALAVVVRGFGVTHYALAQRSLDFRSRTVAEVADVAVRGAVALALAASGRGAWSLIIGHVAGSTVFAATLWLLVRWRPDLRRARTPLRRLMAFGGALTGVNVLASIIANADYVIVGRVLGVTALGLYTIAFKLPEALISNLSTVAGRVLFPAFAGEDREKLPWRLMTAFRFTLLVCLPVAMMMVILAPELVAAVFGHEWGAAVGPMRWLVAYALATALGTPAGSVYKATGRADILIRLALPRTVIGVVAIAVVASRGIAFVAGANTAMEVILTVTGLVVARRLLGLRLREVARSCAPIAVAGIAAAAIMVGIAALVRDPLITLGLAVPAGAATYLGGLWLVGRDVLEHVWRLARPARTVTT